MPMKHGETTRMAITDHHIILTMVLTDVEDADAVEAEVEAEAEVAEVDQIHKI